jgi:hypothetical protein
MSWTYSGRPDESDKDAVRIHCGDTQKERPLLSDGEIAYFLTTQPIVFKAAAMACRAIAARFSAKADMSVGDVSRSCSQMADMYSKRAIELDNDPAGIVPFVLPSFGGLSISEKETLTADTDAVQPDFQRGMYDDGTID